MDIQLHDRTFSPYMDHEEILKIVSELAQRINSDYAKKEPLFLSILNGSFMFTADLFKYLTIPCRVSFVKVASYEGTSTTGEIKELIGLERSLENEHVIILEDIIDTGTTLSKLWPSIESQNPASLKLCSLLLKPDALQHDLPLDYIGKRIPNDFIVGYGLDYDGLGRNLKDIYQVVD